MWINWISSNAIKVGLHCTYLDRMNAIDDCHRTIFGTAIVDHVAHVQSGNVNVVLHDLEALMRHLQAQQAVQTGVS